MLSAKIVSIFFGGGGEGITLAIWFIEEFSLSSWAGASSVSPSKCLISDFTQSLSPLPDGVLQQFVSKQTVLHDQQWPQCLLFH